MSRYVTGIGLIDDEDSARRRCQWLIGRWEINRCSREGFRVLGMWLCGQHEDILMGEIRAGINRDERFRSKVWPAVEAIRRAEIEAKRAREIVYFVERDGFVKIGKSRTDVLKSRLSNLAAGDCSIAGMTPGPVRLIGTIQGGLERERQVHANYWHCHVDGEWFLPDARMRAMLLRVESRSIDQQAAVEDSPRSTP